MNNNFVISITKSDRAVPALRADRSNEEELPEITIYQTKSGEYSSNNGKL